MGHFEAHGSAVPPFSIEPHFRPSVPGKTGPRKCHGSSRTTRPRNNPILDRHLLFRVNKLNLPKFLTPSTLIGTGGILRTKKSHTMESAFSAATTFGADRRFVLFCWYGIRMVAASIYDVHALLWIFLPPPHLALCPQNLYCLSVNLAYFLTYPSALPLPCGRHICTPPNATS